MDKNHGVWCAKFVMLGSGQPEYETYFKNLDEKISRGKAGMPISDLMRNLAHRDYGRFADMFLMPSRYEPCGLTQMYSLAYGSAPDCKGNWRT